MPFVVIYECMGITIEHAAKFRIYMKSLWKSCAGLLASMRCVLHSTATQKVCSSKGCTPSIPWGSDCANQILVTNQCLIESYVCCMLILIIFLISSLQYIPVIQVFLSLQWLQDCLNFLDVPTQSRFLRQSFDITARLHAPFFRCLKSCSWTLICPDVDHGYCKKGTDFERSSN